MMKQIFIFIITVMLLSGCGGSSSSSSSGGGESNPPSSDVDMVISETYTVYSGDQLVKTVEGTLVGIAHVDGQNQSIVVLLEGSAKIIRK